MTMIMKTTLIFFSFFLGFLLVSRPAQALVSSNGMGGGAWSAAPSWDSGVPVCGDSILIRSGDIVTIASQQDYSACGSPMVLIIDGTITFPGNGPKLKLPAGSTIIVNIGGLISAPGGGNGNKISIGEFWVWEKSDGDVPGYACFGMCSPLPVQFLSVEATLIDRNVCIKWTTATESNNDFFTVERSSDGAQYIDIAQVKGAGTTNSIIDYKVKDIHPTAGVYYYRVRQVDFDGTFAYSEIVSVTVDFPNSSDVILYPNPSFQSEDLQIVLTGLSAQQEVKIEVRNIHGELDHVQFFVTVQDGDASITVSTAGRLQPGLYFISVIIDGEVQTSQVVIR